jgi:hypothetical protein
MFGGLKRHTKVTLFWRMWLQGMVPHSLLPAGSAHSARAASAAGHQRLGAVEAMAHLWMIYLSKMVVFHGELLGCWWYIYLIVDLKVHVEIVHYKGRQGPRVPAWDAASVFFFWVRESIFCLGERFRERFWHETPAKDKRGVRQSFANLVFFLKKNRKEWPASDKGNPKP